MMIRIVALISVLALFIGKSINLQAQEYLKLWYDKPAEYWNEALPLGNGRLGVMVYGHPEVENIQLNENTFWSGGPSRNDNPEALKALPEIRQLIFNGKYKEAETLVNQKIKHQQLQGSRYQTIGNLKLSFPKHAKFTNYYRELNLQNAIFTTSYTVDKVEFKREVFVSEPDQVVVVKLSASKPGQLTFVADLSGPLQKSIRAIDASTLQMTGLSGSHEGVEGQVKFAAQTQIKNIGGSVTKKENKIKVTAADEVVLLISVATNFVDYKTLTANETERCKNYLSAANKKTYKQLQQNHVKAYQELFKRVSFKLETSVASSFPTDVRVKYFSKTMDPELVVLYYQFGRYLLISSSQPGGQPANLQGIWNGSTSPAWDSKYTININTEMNYWPAEKCNLSEMHEPLIQMVRDLSETGRQTAKNMYGCSGWVVHHNTDIWRISGLVDGAFWGMWPMGGGWLSQHLWERYLYTGDAQYLKSVYPIFKSACEFYQDFLIEEPKNNWLVVSPSISPENAPKGHGTSVCAGATMDNQILFDLFSKTIAAAKLLNVDNSEQKKWQKILDRLPPMQIGQHGQLQEWMEDLDDPNDKHRHVSHLYGLHPSNQISPYRTPELFNAARTTLNQRGDISTGWSMGWKVNFWARLQDGNHAFKLISDQLSLVDPSETSFSASGGTYPNLFDAHPPFQIDGNFGCTSGINEMLMQSHDGAIHLLPALPDAWSDGEIKGIKAQGGFVVDIKWRNGEFETATIQSTLGGNCRIRSYVPLKGVNLLEAKGENPNHLFAVPEVSEPLIHNQKLLKAPKIKKVYEYDIQTQAEEIISFSIKR
ncbi:glycoside hydrolase family 95 protein [uncultured Draconibacterium sp.]|uniref:glycoside hydrolase family 95 protein n=1 Tax=uncultured Draconibacterium sp. TaxID=1573823 RepID=UPI0032616EBF